MKIKYLSSIVFINDKMFFQALIDTHTNFILQSVLIIILKFCFSPPPFSSSFPSSFKFSDVSTPSPPIFSDRKKSKLEVLTDGPLGTVD